MRFPQKSFPNQYLSIAAPVAVFALLVSMFSLCAQAANPVTFSPTSLGYGDVVVGTSQSLTVEIVNNEKTSVTISSVAGSNSRFAVQKLKLPQTVAAGGHMSVSITFTPTTTGLLNGHVTVVGNGFNEAFGVSGTGTTQTKTELTITPSSLNFGDVVVGGTGTQTAALSATGGSVTVTSASSSSSLFALAGAKLPFTIASGKSVSVNVTFTPQKNGAATGTLTFASNAANSTTSDPVSGTGTAPMVSISWVASTSSGISGYNVYRSTSPNGSYVKLNSSLVAATNYTDTTVSKGSYAYAATAVNSKGEESAYSAVADVVVP